MRSNEIIATKKKGKVNDKLTFKKLTPRENKIIKRLKKRKIMKFPSRWRNAKKLEKELNYLSNEQKTVLARAGRIRFNKITGR